MTEQAEVLPHFRKTPRSPAIPESAGGIALAADPPRVAPDGPSWPLRGSFRMGRAAGPNETVLRRIVLVLTSDASNVTQARHAAGDVVLFGNDVMAGPTAVMGYFNVNLADLFELENRQETFHIVASIGEHTSEVLTCKVDLPWIDFPRAEPAGEQESEAEEEPEEDEEEEADDDSWMVDEPQE